jgi:hypothetical protein
VGLSREEILDQEAVVGNLVVAVKIDTVEIKP